MLDDATRDFLDVATPYWVTFSLLITVVYQTSFFLVACTCKFDKVTDLAGGTNFVVVAVACLLANGTYYTRQIVITICVSVWGIRLSGYLLYRIIVTETDERFDDKREDCVKFAAFWIVQGLWVWILMIPVCMVNYSTIDTGFGPLGIVGLVMFVFGFLLEAVADAQKFSFKQDEANKGKWCAVGVWSWSRHPNYVGEISLWFGMWVMAIPEFASDAAQWASIVSPLFITILLLFVSGIPILEYNSDKKHRGKPEYIEYKKSVSPVIPMPQSVYRSLPNGLKSSCCCEFGYYNQVDITVKADEKSNLKGEKVGSGGDVEKGEGGGGGKGAGKHASDSTSSGSGSSSSGSASHSSSGGDSSTKSSS